MLEATAGGKQNSFILHNKKSKGMKLNTKSFKWFFYW